MAGDSTALVNPVTSGRWTLARGGGWLLEVGFLEVDFFGWKRILSATGAKVGRELSACWASSISFVSPRAILLNLDPAVDGVGGWRRTCGFEIAADDEEGLGGNILDRFAGLGVGM